MGRWIRAEVIAISNSYITFQHDDGRIERIEKSKVKKLIIPEAEPMLVSPEGKPIRASKLKSGDKIMSYVRLPGMSTHMGTHYEGICIER